MTARSDSGAPVPADLPGSPLAPLAKAVLAIRHLAAPVGVAGALRLQTAVPADAVVQAAAADRGTRSRPARTAARRPTGARVTRRRVPAAVAGLQRWLARVALHATPVIEADPNRGVGRGPPRTGPGGERIMVRGERTVGAQHDGTHQAASVGQFLRIGVERRMEFVAAGPPAPAGQGPLNLASRVGATLQHDDHRPATLPKCRHFHSPAGRAPGFAPAAGAPFAPAPRGVASRPPRGGPARGPGGAPTPDGVL